MLIYRDGARRREEPPAPGHAFESVSAAGREVEIATGRQVSHGRRHEDLSGRRHRGNSCGDVNGDPR
jgi:hypothetical protein